MSQQRQRFISGLASLACVAFLCGPASAGITYTSQARSVGGKGWEEVPIPDPPYFTLILHEGTIQAPDFGPFNETWKHTTSATQNSVLTPTGISASGGAVAWDFYYKMTKIATGATSSDLSVEFTIDEPTPFALQGSLSANSGGWAGSSFVSLDGPGLSLWFSTVQKYPLLEFAEQGVLVPGTYSIKGKSNAFGAGLQGGGASFNFSFLVPSPGVGVMMAMVGSLQRRPRRAASV